MIPRTPPAPLPAARLADAVLDLMRAELSLQRRGAEGPWPEQAPMTVPLGTGGLAADSLERTWLALAVHHFFTLEGTAWEDKVLPARTVGEVAEIGAARLAVPQGAAISFATSGSTGAPKRVRHALADLAAEAAQLAALLPGRRRVVRLVPAHHIYGFLFTVLLPQVLDVPVVEARRGGVGPLPGRLAAGDLVVGFPLVWAQAARYWTPGALPPDVTLVTSTAPCPPETVAALHAAGAARVVEVYGASETGGVGWRDEAAAPFRPLPHLARCGDGLSRDGRPLPLQDRLVWEAEGFRVAGRLDGAVQVGGVNVRTAAVRDRLVALPGVVAAEVTPVKTPGGLRLAAVLTVAPATEEAAVRAAVDALPAAERPVDVIVRRP